MALESTALRDLAGEIGVSTEYWGWDGNRNHVGEDTLRAVLAALGYDVAADEDIDRVRVERSRAGWERVLPPVVVLRESAGRTVPVHVEHGSAVQVRLELEDGQQRSLTQVEDFTPPVDLDGTLRGQASFDVPADLPLGWHRLLAETSQGTYACDLVVTPDHLDVHATLGAGRAMGVQAQLYSIRSPRSWGIGDLADARDLAAILGSDHDADFLLVNPLHAGSPQPPIEPSPYLPTTRRFVGALYVRPEDIPEYRYLAQDARERIAALRERSSGENERADRLERDQVLAAKNTALEELFTAQRTPARQALFESFRRREGQGLEDYALWCALEEVREELDEESLAGLRSPDGPLVEQARRDLAPRVEFHAWVQWVIDEQLADTQHAALASGMRVGMMLDLAVGVLQEGADAWALSAVMAQGVGVGAPADQYNQQGQNWNQPPWHPEALAEAGYRPWRDMLRSLMRHAGALRIDHVLGLFRLWWIPQGNAPADGAYVHYDHEAMIGILALEAQRAGALVVGEDLGTFEPWVREYLTDRGILGTSILWFENDWDGNPVPPSNYRRLCLASVNTHDLPPTAGYLAGDHVRLRSELGLLERPLAEELAADEAGRQKVLQMLREEGVLRPDADPEVDVEETIIALHRHLASTPSLLIGVSLVDCVGERRIQNQPGTDEEYPNWRIPLADPDGRVVSVDDVASSERTVRLLTAVREQLTAQR